MIRVLIPMLALGACATMSAPVAPAERASIDRYDEDALRSAMADLKYAVVDTSVSDSGKRPAMVRTMSSRPISPAS